MDKMDIFPKEDIRNFVQYVDIDIVPQWCEIIIRVHNACNSKNKCIAITADNYLGTITDVGDDDRIRFNMESYEWYDAMLKSWKY